MEDESGATVVVKISGTLMRDGGAPEAFWQSVQALGDDANVVLVHGGGKQMTALSERLGHSPTVVQGRRVTGDLDLDVALWAMGGELNTRLVAQASRHGLTATGLTGADAHLLSVSKRPPWTVDGETVDFGWVGDVEGVNASVLTHLLSAGILPVVAALGMDDDGAVYNVNADTVAHALAAGLGADALFFVTGSGGVQRCVEDPSTIVDCCTPATYRTGIEKGWITGGMRVKVETALAALRDGVDEAYICAPDDLLTRTHSTRVSLENSEV
jgi:acetylglutamate kinase